MQKACWQDESEVFGEDQPESAPHKRTVAYWEHCSMTSGEVREDDAMHARAAETKVKHPWAPPSIHDLDAQFDKELAAQDYQFKTPWNQMSRVEQGVLQRDSQQSMSYNYEPIWKQPSMTASRLEQLAGYEMKTPYEREGDPQEGSAGKFKINQGESRRIKEMDR